MAGSLLQISRTLVAGMSPTNNQKQITPPLVSTGQRQLDTISLEWVRKHHKVGTGTKDFIPGFIVRNSASDYQFLLADTTTCKISSLWWPSKVRAGLLYQQPKGCPAAMALSLCKMLLQFANLWKATSINLPGTIKQVSSPGGIRGRGQVESFWNLPLFVIYN